MKALDMSVLGKPDHIEATDRIDSVAFEWTRSMVGGRKAMNATDQQRDVVVRTLGEAARDIRTLELAPADGGSLPHVEAGAHIDLHLPNGLVRQYSVMQAGRSPHSYRIGVLRAADSRGGSACVVDELVEGDQVAIGAPRNHFGLDESATHYILVAGGIGITPLVSMARRLTELGRRVELHYLLRARERAAFLDELESILPNDALHLHIDGEGGTPDLGAIAGTPESGRQLYACGPAGLLDALRAATAEWPAGHVHFEQFANPEATKEAPTGAACEVELRRSGVRFVLEPAETLLTALHRHDIDVPCACQEGVCGTCAVEIVEGDVDHRDALQDDEEKASNDVMFVCVSRPLGEHLVLDL